VSGNKWSGASLAEEIQSKWAIPSRVSTGISFWVYLENREVVGSEKKVIKQSNEINLIDKENSVRVAQEEGEKNDEELIEGQVQEILESSRIPKNQVEYLLCRRYPRTRPSDVGLLAKI
jgi:hypothetical protein